MNENLHLAALADKQQSKRVKKTPLGEDAQASITAINSNTDAKIETLAGRLDSLSSKVDHVDGRGEVLDDRLSKESKRIDQLFGNLICSRE